MSEPIDSSRGVLSKKHWEEIESKIQLTFREIQDQLWRHDPFVLGFSGLRLSHLQIAVVCLVDACRQGTLIRHSLQEAYAHLKWYRELVPQAPMEQAAVFWANYYADNAALRMYPAMEDMAEFILAFFKIDKSILKRREEKSLASQVGAYLKSQKPNHDITKIADSLMKNGDFRNAIEYRGKWVHKQPPVIADSGLAWKRKNRWKELPDGRSQMSLDERDEPDYTIDQLLEMLRSAAASLNSALALLAQAFTQEIKP
ncbi:MAG: hypothetical protein ABIJ61_12055 [bacterium]